MITSTKTSIPNCNIDSDLVTNKNCVLEGKKKEYLEMNVIRKLIFNLSNIIQGKGYVIDPSKVSIIVTQDRIKAQTKAQTKSDLETKIKEHKNDLEKLQKKYELSKADQKQKQENEIKRLDRPQVGIMIGGNSSDGCFQELPSYTQEEKAYWIQDINDRYKKQSEENFWEMKSEECFFNSKILELETELENLNKSS